MKRYASLALTPGKVGTYVQTKLHEMHDMSCCYHPCAVAPADLAAAVAGLRVLGFDGFAVSSPHKTAVIEHVDAVSDGAYRMMAANTVVRDDTGRLVAHNTDGQGFTHAYSKLIAGWGVTAALVLGAGPAARAVCGELFKLGVDYVMAARPGRNRDIAIASTSEQHVVNWAYWDKCLNDSLVVNTAPAAAFGSNANMTLDFNLSRAKACIDITSIGDESVFMQSAKRATPFPPVGGLSMAIAQSMRQFELYTGHTLDEFSVLHAQFMKGWRVR